MASSLGGALASASAGPLLVAGLMSGTSADGIDVAICRVAAAAEPAAIDCLHFETVPYPEGFKAALLAMSADGRIADVCRFNVLIGKLFAEAVRTACAHCNMSMDQLHLIGR
jgi:anhydro-N-acetylmuramic acid kinase